MFNINNQNHTQSSFIRGMVLDQGIGYEHVQKDYVNSVTFGLRKLIVSSKEELISTIACIPNKAKANVAKKLLKEATTVVTNGFSTSRAFIEYVLLKTNIVSSMNFYAKDGELKTPDTKGGFIVNILTPELFEKVGALSIEGLKVNLIKTYLSFDKNSVEPRTLLSEVELGDRNSFYGVLRAQRVTGDDFTVVYYCVVKFDIYGNILSVENMFNVGDVGLLEAEVQEDIVTSLMYNLSDSDTLLDWKPLTSGKVKKEGVRKSVSEDKIQEATEAQEATDEEASNFVEGLDQTEEV